MFRTPIINERFHNNKKIHTITQSPAIPGLFFVNFEQFIQRSKDRFVVLRHDVDKLPENSLKTAQIESELGIKGTYYFRNVPESFNEIIIRQIAELGHEIGYHYENLDFASRKFKVKSC